MKELAPYHTHTFTELCGNGWEKFRTAMVRSNGRAFVAMHPWYASEIRDLEYDKAELDDIQEDFSLRFEAARSWARFDEYERHMARTIVSADRVGLPIVMCIDTQWNIGGSDRRKREKIIESVTRYQKHLLDANIVLSHPVFYLPTAFGRPSPLLKDRKDTYASGLRLFIELLQNHGLSYFVIGGMYFGGNFCTNVFDKVYKWNPSAIARFIKNDRQRHTVEGPKRPAHVLEVAHVEEDMSCVGKFLHEVVQQSTMRFRIGRGITHPQQTPLFSELVDSEDWDRLVWVKGF